MVTLFIILFCTSCTVFSQQNIPDISLNNIKEIKIFRSNCYDYSGGGTNVIDKSNQGILVLQLNKPKNIWVVYLFDLSPIINEDNVADGIEHRKILNPDDEYDSLVVFENDTLSYQRDFKDTCYNRKIARIDTLDYIKYRIDTVFAICYDTPPEVITINRLFENEYYVLHNNKVRYREDSLFYDFYLGDILPGNAHSMYKLLLPTNGKYGSIDSLIITEIIVDALRQYSDEEYAHLYPDNKTRYTQIEKRFGRTGFIVCKDDKKSLWFASGSALFKLADTIEFNDKEMIFTSLGTSFIISTTKNGIKQHTFFSKLFPKGKTLALGDYDSISIGINGFIDFTGMDELYEMSHNSICIFSHEKIALLDKLSAAITPIKKGWVLLKDYGWIHGDIPLIPVQYVNHFRDHIFEYMDKLIFLTPKKQIMIYGNSKFYELNIKKLKGR
ncbi:MAG: hypothetical protein ACKOX1_06140 [Ignavibacteria bacterium]